MTAPLLTGWLAVDFVAHRMCIQPSNALVEFQPDGKIKQTMAKLWKHFHSLVNNKKTMFHDGLLCCTGTTMQFAVQL